MGSNSRPKFQPTLATIAQLDALTENVQAAVDGIVGRLTVIEFTLGKLIEDVYQDGEEFEPVSEPEPAVDRNEAEQRDGFGGVA